MISQRDFKWVNEQRKAARLPPVSREEFQLRGLNDRSRFVDAAGFNAAGVRVLGETESATADHG